MPYKVPIPSLRKGKHYYDWVNPKQAARMLILRAKKAKRSLKLRSQNCITTIKIDSVTGKFSKPRKKD